MQGNDRTIIKIIQLSHIILSSSLSKNHLSPVQIASPHGYSIAKQSKKLFALAAKRAFLPGGFAEDLIESTGSQNIWPSLKNQCVFILGKKADILPLNREYVRPYLNELFCGLCPSTVSQGQTGTAAYSLSWILFAVPQHFPTKSSPAFPQAGTSRRPRKCRMSRKKRQSWKAAY